MLNFKNGKMKSLIELRTFAVEKAAFLGGVGAPSAQVLAVAKEIEGYVLGGEQLPFTAESELSSIGEMLNNAITAAK
jgi:hypothetical protein